jgi:hypothetical protein
MFFLTGLKENVAKTKTSILGRIIKTDQFCVQSTKFNVRVDEEV